MAYPSTPKKKKRKSSTARRSKPSPQALGGRQKPWQVLGITKKQFDLANKYGKGLGNLPGGAKLKSAVQSRLGTRSPKDASDARHLARNLAGIAEGADKFKKTLPSEGLGADPSTQARIKRKLGDMSRDVTLMGEYPSGGDFQRARSFRSAPRSVAEGRYEAGGGPLKKPSKKKGSTSKRRSPGALGGKRKQTQETKYHQSAGKRIGVTPKTIKGSQEFLDVTEDLKGSKKLRGAIKQKVKSKDFKDLQPIASNLAGMGKDVKKWVASQPKGTVHEGSPKTRAKKRQVERDIGLMAEYPSGGDFQKARSFRSSRKEEGGPVKRNSRDGYARGGLTKVAREDDSTTLMQAGGYLGGLTESGRGTMAGELGPRGALPVREAGETMYERSKRRRGFKGGGAVSSYNRRYNNQNK